MVIHKWDVYLAMRNIALILVSYIVLSPLRVINASEPRFAIQLSMLWMMMDEVDEFTLEVAPATSSSSQRNHSLIIL